MLFSHRIPGKSAFLYIVMFSILFFLFLRKQGFISKILDNNISVILGASSYSIYVIHPVVSEYIKYLIYNSHVELVNSHALIYIAILFLSAIIFGFLVHYFVENRINKFLKEKIKL